MNVLILVVDDEPDVEVLFRQQFRRDLRAGRFTMAFAQSALAALQCISNATDALACSGELADIIDLLANCGRNCVALQPPQTSKKKQTKEGHGVRGRHPESAHGARTAYALDGGPSLAGLLRV